MKPVRDLLKHSSVYMIGQILTRMASILLLPLYTHCLSPADYGVIAILDLTTAILGTMICEGMVSAVTRFHFDSDDSGHQDRVWWTGITSMMITGLAVLLPMWLARHVLSDVALGSQVMAGPWFFTLAFATILVGLPAGIVDTYLRVLKWSGVFVAISLARLLINVSLNVWFLVGLQMGIEGLLLGNLIATAVHSVALSIVFLRTRGRFRFCPKIAKALLRYSAPLVVTAITAMLMHEADRYVLRVYGSMDEVGVYSLAHKIGFAVNTLCLLSFSSIWHVAIYDIERLPNAKEMFGKVYGWFTSGLGILLLGAALTVHPILPLLTPDAYGGAMDLISVILLGFFVFGLNFMFEVPAMLSKKTRLMVPGSIAGLIVNIGMNFALVPYFGPWGAAWAGVLTYAAFSFTVLACCRTVMKIEYPWIKSVWTTTAFCATYVALRFGCFPYVDMWAEVGLSVAVCAFWAIALFGTDALDWWMNRKPSADREADDLCQRPAGEESVRSAEPELAAVGSGSAED